MNRQEIERRILLKQQLIILTQQEIKTLEKVMLIAAQREKEGKPC